MHKTAAETLAFLDVFLPLAANAPQGIDIVVAPAFTSLAAAHARLAGNERVALGAQNMHWMREGAHTGEISAPMLLEHGVSYVIVGHSERRAANNENSQAVNLKAKAALEAGMTPIVAVGETQAQRDAGETDTVIVEQTQDALSGLGHDALARIVLAYEPVWAIGTGRNCDAAEADRVMGVMRSCVNGLHATPILYGGSMKAVNVASYMAKDNINGGLVGGASLDPAGFAELIRNAAPGAS